MATIRERPAKSGKRYHVQVRIHGHPPVTASFRRLTDARKWAASQEAAIREGRTVTSSEARRRTLGEAIDRYLESVLPGLQAKDEPDRRRHLDWWRERMGRYVLSQVTPSLIAGPVFKESSFRTLFRILQRFIKIDDILIAMN